MTTQRIADRIAALTAQGFTVARQGRHLRIRCSQCDALVINNVATHELGCPNDPRGAYHCKPFELDKEDA